MSTADLFSIYDTELALPKSAMFARFPRTVDLSERSRCMTAIVAALSARRSARNDETIVSASITKLANDIGASPSHIGRRTLRHLEAEEVITRTGGGWKINKPERGWFKFPEWAIDAGLSRNAIVVLLGICSSAYADDANGRITVTYNQLRDKLGMNRGRVIKCVKELENAGVLIVHRSRAEGHNDYNNPNKYTVCYAKRPPKPVKAPRSMAWNRPTQELVDLLMNDPEWAGYLAGSNVSKKYQRLVEQAVGRLATERSPDDLARKLLGGRGLDGIKSIWGVMIKRLDDIPLIEDRELAHAHAAWSRGEISKAQYDLAVQQVRGELELLSHTRRPE